MKTLDRYVASTFVKNLLLAILSLTCLFVFQALLGELYDHNYPAHQILFYHLLNVPQVIVQMTPPSVLLATVLTLSGFARHNELIACYSIGTGLARLTALIVSIVFIVSCCVLIMEDRILPPVFKKRTTYYMREMEKRSDFFLDLKLDKIWYRSKNMIYNLERFDTKSNTIHGMSVYTFDENFNLVQVVSAETGQFTSHGWRLQKGTVTIFSAENAFPMTKQFQEKDVLLSETPRDFQEIDKEVKGARLKELWAYIGRMKTAGADTKSYEVDFHSRISLSFIPIVMCMLGVPFSVRSRREGSVAKDLGLCLVITFFYWLFYSIGLSLGTNGALPPWLAAWLPSAIFGVLVAALIIRQR